jgi:hypothetical protein
LATLNEIAVGEAEFKARHSIDVRDEDEWMQLRDIVARIERKLMAKLPAKDAAE